MGISSETPGSIDFRSVRERLARIDVLPVVVLGAILVLGCYFRLRRLGVAPLWIDEAYTSWAARNYINGNGFSDPIGPSSPYQRAWLTTSLPIAGSFALLDISEFAARLPVVIYGLLSILVGYLFGRRYNRLLGYFLAAYLAFDPFMLVWSREARMYGPLLFFYLTSVYVLVVWFEKKNFSFTSAYPYLLGILVFLGMKTQRSYLALGAGVLAFLGIELVTRLRNLDEVSMSAVDRETTRIAILTVGATGAAVAYLAVEGVPSILFLSPPETWPDRGPIYYGKVLAVNATVLTPLAGLGMVYTWWRHKELRIAMLALVVPLIVASITPRKAPRYIYHLMPLLALFGLYIVSMGLRAAWRAVTDDGADELSVFESGLCYTVPILVLLVVASPVAAYGVTTSLYDPPTHPERSDWEKASQWLTENAADDDLVASTRPELSMWYYGETDYFFRQNGVSRGAWREGQYVHTRTGAVYLNSTAAIEAALQQDRDIWLLAGKKFHQDFTAPEARQLVHQEFERRGDPSWTNMAVYHYDTNATASDREG
ncbi:glycosyltransferase family 39 protein [Halosimplex pelagicum]|uniref:Glycosyltransferase family 39 protein n=1 Tax=Halosimplex pelagicum TaxID=869886 RepID=A0A7D5PDQ4_9EURY|nr:glycosyltransferase family 39 protein [Halosimplex pelagicum]QLH81260.1 glycosyltransferase family 39 protein [Halosimplex pelagicum]